MADSTNNILFREAEVVSVWDENGEMTLKVNLYPYDSYSGTTNLNNIVKCYPLLPKHLQVSPKQGEKVLIITSNQLSTESKRYFIGPVISQQYDLAQGTNKNPHLLPRPDLNPNNKGTCPDRDDIAIQGRNNADLIFKDSEVRLRCGFKQDKNQTNNEFSLLFNKEDMAYIQMKYSPMIDERNKQGFASSINVVADRINLLSHDSITPFRLSNSDLIDDELLAKILREAHPLIYGDNLVNFLKQLIEIIRTHSHPFPQKPPCFTQPQTEVLNTNLDEMLSQSIKIN